LHSSYSSRTNSLKEDKETIQKKIEYTKVPVRAILGRAIITLDSKKFRGSPGVKKNRNAINKKGG